MKHILGSACLLACVLFASSARGSQTTTPAEKDPPRHTGFLADIKR